MSAASPVAAGTAPQMTIGQAGADGARRLAGGSRTADSPSRSSRTGRCAGDGGAPLGDGAGCGASLVERGYVQARFGGLPVLLGPEFANQLRAIRKEQP